MTSRILELFTIPTRRQGVDWKDVVGKHHCSYLGKECVKCRKSQPEIAIGTCSVRHGAEKEVIICPHRFLERRQVLMDCIHLLTLHEPGNELHRVSEVSIPGGSIDYFLVSVRDGKVADFAGIELQAVDTTGTLWPERQRFLQSVGVKEEESEQGKPFGLNWKMTAKTILVQLHHKIETFEQMNKHLALVLQDWLFAYMEREFSFSHVTEARLGDSMHFHTYSLKTAEDQTRLHLRSRKSTDAEGIARCLGRQAQTPLELEQLTTLLQRRISEETLLTV
jgi:hypothetical protein